eukprot:GHVO01069586.1.p1 GENE.GHVO01069586.1~~GHVO01069586.1.p1  ORF type:complete len:627 (+),score=181.09 GHVO01069586.1:50-1930(+)
MNTELMRSLIALCTSIHADSSCCILNTMIDRGKIIDQLSLSTGGSVDKAIEEERATYAGRMGKLGEDTDQIQLEDERLTMTREHVNKQREALIREQQEINDAVDGQTIKVREQRDLATVKKKGVDDEIKDLEKILAEKTEERREYENIINTCDIEISGVKAKYRKQLNRISKVEHELCEAERDLEGEVRMHEKRKEIRDGAMEREKDRHNKVMQETADIEAMNRWLSREKTRSERVKGGGERILEEESASCPSSLFVERSQIWEQVEIKENEKKRLSGECDQIQKDMRHLRSRVSQYEMRKPELSEERKGAVANRAFREASRITAEIKEVEDGLAVARKELIDVQGRMEKTSTALNTADDEIQSLRECFEESDSAADLRSLSVIRRCMHLSQKIEKDMRRRQRNFERLDNRGDSFSPSYRLFLGTLITLLNGELKIVQSEQTVYEDYCGALCGKNNWDITDFAGLGGDSDSMLRGDSSEDEVSPPASQRGGDDGDGDTCEDRMHASVDDSMHASVDDTMHASVDDTMHASVDYSMHASVDDSMHASVDDMSDKNDESCPDAMEGDELEGNPIVERYRDKKIEDIDREELEQQLTEAIETEDFEMAQHIDDFIRCRLDPPVDPAVDT